MRASLGLSLRSIIAGLIRTFGVAFMFERKIPVLVMLATGSIAALFSGGSFLEVPLFGVLPVGNVLAAGALCSSAGVAVGLSYPATVLRYCSVAALVAASAWLPVSIALAGNFTLNFSGLRGQIWICLSLATIVIVLLVVAWATIDRLIRRRLHRESASGA